MQWGMAASEGVVKFDARKLAGQLSNVDIDQGLPD
jgi:hypothetical protein